jgi:2-oxoisovalerate dehydrogenase E1 component
LDWDAIVSLVESHCRVMVLTEEPLLNSFAESLAGRISKHCFKYLDAPVQTVGAANLPAVPLNAALERQMLPNAELVREEIQRVLNF